jgi:hypothetical protein
MLKKFGVQGVSAQQITGIFEPHRTAVSHQSTRLTTTSPRNLTAEANSATDP